MFSLIKYIPLFLLLLSTSHARLGENREELVSRLGHVQTESKHVVLAQGKSSPLGPELSFRKDQGLIQCDMVAGCCARIKYTKRGDWTPDQIATLLKNNAQGALWAEAQDSTKMNRKWHRRDGGLATWKFTGEMQLLSPAYLKAKAQREAELKSEAQKMPDL